MRLSMAADISRQVLLVLHSISGGSPPKETFLCTDIYTVYICPVPACFSMCIVLGACLLLCLWASSWHPLFYESILLPVFIVAFILRSTWLRLMCFMLHAPWSLPQAPGSSICSNMLCFCVFLFAIDLWFGDFALVRDFLFTVDVSSAFCCGN